VMLALLMLSEFHRGRLNVEKGSLSKPIRRG